MRSLGKLALLATVALLIFAVGSAHAVTWSNFHLRFDNLDLDLGLSSQIDLNTQYHSQWGISFNKAYRYIDIRDPFLDPGALAGPQNFGVSNGNISQNTVNGATGKLFFDFGNTSYFTFDWWTISENDMHVKAYNDAGVLQDQFDFDGSGGPGFGTTTLNGDIDRVEFRNGGGFVNMANIKYESPVPEPGTMALFGTGLVGLAMARRRRRAKK